MERDKGPVSHELALCHSSFFTAGWLPWKKSKPRKKPNKEQGAKTEKTPHTARITLPLLSPQVAFVPHGRLMD
jgi:hypothetical protein